MLMCSNGWRVFAVVTLYATLGEEGVAHSVNESQVSIVLTSSELLPKFQAIFKRLKRVKHLICIDETKKLPSSDIVGGIDLHSMKKVEEMGKSSDNGRDALLLALDTKTINYRLFS
jgi:long-chain acyl-CoA synthetase